jgi:hypothetical protein
MAATKARPKTPGSRTASVRGVVTEIHGVLKTIDKSSATALKKKRAKKMLESVIGVIEAFCLANARRKDYSESEFEVGRGKKKPGKKNK